LKVMGPLPRFGAGEGGAHSDGEGEGVPASVPAAPSPFPLLRNGPLPSPAPKRYGIHESDSSGIRTVIQAFGSQFAGRIAMAFGDIRVTHRAEWLMERIATTGSVVPHKLGETRAGEMAIHRFLLSPYVSVERIADELAARTAVQCAGRHILVV